jgi:hypothetical protein
VSEQLREANNKFSRHTETPTHKMKSAFDHAKKIEEILRADNKDLTVMTEN